MGIIFKSSKISINKLKMRLIFRWKWEHLVFGERFWWELLWRRRNSRAKSKKKPLKRTFDQSILILKIGSLPISKNRVRFTNVSTMKFQTDLLLNEWDFWDIWVTYFIVNIYLRRIFVFLLILFFPSDKNSTEIRKNYFILRILYWQRVE